MKAFKKTLVVVATICATSSLFASNLDQLIKSAQAEGEVNSVGMPDSWANWKDTWVDLKTKYGLKHIDTDMSSAQEIAKFIAEKNNASADIGDVGISFGPIAVKKGVTVPFKTSYWDQVPSWAKDKDGHWMLAYTGTIAFLINNENVKNPPSSWADIAKGTYKIATGDVNTAAQAINGVLALNYALGGDESDLTPALKFYSKIAKQGRLSMADPSAKANLEKGEIEVGILWDFNALNYRDDIGGGKYSVVIPSDGSVISGYSTIINKYAKHPNAAKLAREYIFSDKGQINLAKGYARPIRAEHITLPKEVSAKLLSNDQYKSARPIKDWKAWKKSTKKLPRQWQEEVIVNLK